MRPLLLLAVLAGLALPAAARAELPSGADWYKDPSVNATWTQAYIKEDGGPTLHADILRPAGLSATAKTPVIMSIGPYFNHSGQTEPTENPAGSTAWPSTRFVDFIVGGKLMQRGYTYVMVDLRGFGGSTGCSDFGGVGEQADVKAAVEWAASQPWSTGSVGLYGKSYDGVTGLLGEVTQPKGLKAILAQEPVYDEYDYLYTNRVKFPNFAGTPAIYQQLAADPGVVGGDDLQYQINAFASAPCYGPAIAMQAGDDNRDSAFWKQHNYTELAKGHKIPLFMTQGFLEDNTKPLGAWAFYNAIDAPKRGWFAMNDHIRGNDETEGDDAYPRFYDEAMRWFDYWVRGVPLADAPVHKDPANEIQTNDTTWRAEGAWPPVDSVDHTVPLTPGSYTDDGNNNGSAENSTGTEGQGVWTISPPLAAEQRFSGVPYAHLDVTSTLPNANLAANIYDIAPDGTAMMLSRSTYLLHGGQEKIDFELYGNDWKIPAGDRIGILISSSNAEWWQHVATNSPVTLNAGSTVTLPFLKYTRTATIPGKQPSRLDRWLQAAPFTLPEATITAATSPSFPLPPAPTAAPAGSPVYNTATAIPGASLPPTKVKRLTARISVKRLRHHRRRVTVYGRAPAGARRVIRLRGGKRAAVRRVRTKLSAYRVSFTVRRRGRYRARVTGRVGATRLRAVSRSRRVR
jgi:predicted acyl esterase